MRLGVLSDATTDILDQLNQLPLITQEQADSDWSHIIPTYIPPSMFPTGGSGVAPSGLTVDQAAAYNNAYNSALNKGVAQGQAAVMAAAAAAAKDSGGGGSGIGGISTTAWLIVGAAAVVGGLVLMGRR